MPAKRLGNAKPDPTPGAGYERYTIL